MSVSKRWAENPDNVRRVLKLYKDPRILQMHEVAKRLGTRVQNISHVLKHNMPPAELKALQRLRYSASKQGSKNPMKGKTREQHHNWKGECEDGYGYLTCLHNGKRQFVHRVVMAKVLGVEELPAHLDVHHIDSDPKNNTLDNLALVTRKGHSTIHFLQVKDSVALQLKRQHLAEAFSSMTSP